MAILNQKRILNLIPKVSAPVTIHVSQGDVGTEIEFTLVKGDEVFVNPGNVTASVHGVREDGANFGPFTCTLSGSKVTFPLHSEMTVVKGSALAEIVLVDNGGNKVGSANFGILVEESVFPLGVTYDNDVSVYESILAYVQTIPAQVTADYTSKINAEVTARQNAISAVQSNLNTEISARASEDALINARIDEIIAPSGEAPSAAEVQDARIGADETLYTTLGNAIRGQIKNIMEHTVNLAKLCIEGVETIPNTTFTATRNGAYIDIAGTSTGTGAIYATNEIQLSPGTYYYGILNNDKNERVFAQLKKFENGADVGFVETGNANIQHMKSIEITEAMSVKIRLRVEAGTNRSLSTLLYISKADNTNMWNVIPALSAIDYQFRAIMNNIQLQQSGSQYPTSTNPSTDLNDFTDPSWYTLVGATNYSNGPDDVDMTDIPKSLLTVNPSGRGVLGVVLQFLILNYNNACTIYLRAHLAGAWGNWLELYSKGKMNDAINKAFYNYSGSVHPGTTDFNDFIDPGFYSLQGTPDYTNKPSGALLADTPKSLLVFNPGGVGTNTNGMVQILIAGYTIGKMNLYVRIRLGGAWGAWILFYDGTSETFFTNVTISYTPAPQLTQGENVGSKVKIMSYNVAHYTMDNPYQDIPNLKILGFINMLNEHDPDIICVQEDTAYIDQSNTKLSMDYLYYPQYPITTTTTESSIKSKSQPSRSGRLQYSTGRWLTYCTYNIDDNVLLVVSTHLIGGNTQASIDMRAAQMQELYDWLAGDISLENIDTHEMEYGPAGVTHVVIGGDFNLGTDDDWTNLHNIFGGSYTFGNDGRYGRLRTVRNVVDGWKSIDNVIISNNVIFNKMYALSKDWDKLYSDHVPLFAEVTLT